MQKTEYTVRVYAVILLNKNEILVTDEYHFDTKMTKFVGGGMEFGEGTLDCLQREAMEELGQELEILEHLYTTDFYQASEFYHGKQILAIYYLAKLKAEPAFEMMKIPYNFELKNGNFGFRCIPLQQFSAESVTLATDKKAVETLLFKLKNNGIQRIFDKA